MTTDKEHRTQALQRLSAVMDGEADESSVRGACADWRDDAQTRRSWHAYHVVGDLLRADDMRADARHDADFLRAIRSRLEQEPALLAPTHVSPAMPALVTRRAHSTGWRAWGVGAAGVAALAGVLMLMQSPASLPEPALAAAPAPLAVRPVADARPAAAPVAEAPGMVADGQMLRDARLQEYLAAHKQFGGSSALGVPSGFLRSATVDTSKR